MLWREAIGRSGSFLAAKGIEDGEAGAEILAARLLRCGRGELAARLDAEVPRRFVDAMRRGVMRLASGEPVQYVIGEWDFRRLTLKCDRRALIPRPETEELVTRVLAWMETRENPFVVDVGTGTGAIILSIACEYGGDAALLGTDVSEDAVALATENARFTGLEDRVRFAVMDGLDDFDEPGMIDAIVSNPPYIESGAIAALDRRVRDFEPRLALDGGARGLDFYDRYLADALNLLKPNGAVFFEIGDGQGEAVADLMKAYGFTGIRIERDFAGHDRYAFATIV